MKRKVYAALLAAVLVSALTFGVLKSTVRITGECDVRQGPGLKYDVIATASKGDIMEYWDDTVTDERGVNWYNVIYGNLSAWVSSKYAVLEGGSGSASTLRGRKAAADQQADGCFLCSGVCGRGHDLAVGHVVRWLWL